MEFRGNLRESYYGQAVTGNFESSAVVITHIIFVISDNSILLGRLFYCATSWRSHDIKDRIRSGNTWSCQI